MLKLAAILTHNVGDVDQGLGYWSGKDFDTTPTLFHDTSVHNTLIHILHNTLAEDEFPTQRTLFSRLAHEREERFGGEFAKAKVIYKELISAEGHRNDPLREPKCLRMTADLQLPLSVSGSLDMTSLFTPFASILLPLMIPFKQRVDSHGWSIGVDWLRSIQP